MCPAGAGSHRRHFGTTRRSASCPRRPGPPVAIAAMTTGAGPPGVHRPGQAARLHLGRDQRPVHRLGRWPVWPGPGPPSGTRRHQARRRPSPDRGAGDAVSRTAAGSGSTGTAPTGGCLRRRVRLHVQPGGDGHRGVARGQAHARGSGPGRLHVEQRRDAGPHGGLAAASSGFVRERTPIAVGSAWSSTLPHRSTMWSASWLPSRIAAGSSPSRSHRPAWVGLEVRAPDDALPVVHALFGAAA